MQSRSRIPDSQSVKLTFSKKPTFYLTKTENRTKKSLTLLSPYSLSKGAIFTKKCLKNADISKINRAVVLIGIFLKTAYVCVLTHQISSF